MKSRNAHLDDEPCGSCHHLKYESGFWCPVVETGILEQGKVGNVGDSALEVFLAWLVHNNPVPECPAWRTRLGQFRFTKVKMIKEVK